jgi:glycogen phosphorylase
VWWSWNPRARAVFRDLNYPLWKFTDHNPVRWVDRRVAGDKG